MYHSKFLAAAFAAVIVMLAPSCTKEIDPVEPVVKDYSFTASVKGIDNTSINVSFTAGADIIAIKYAVGSAFTQVQDSVKFSKGTLENIFTIFPPTDNFTVEAQIGEPVVVYVSPIDDKGELGDVICLDAVPGPVAYSVSKVSLGSFVYTVPESIGNYAGISLMAMAATTPEEWGMTAEEIIDMYASFAMLDCRTPGESAVVELNGEPNTEHILGVVYWDQDYNYIIKTVDFTTGSIVSGASPASIEVSVSNITANSADFSFTPSETTCAYCYKLYTKDDYDDCLATGSSFGFNPAINYIRELAAAGGSLDYKKMTETREYLSENQKYVLVCFPFNMNGSRGWGESSIVEFTTLAQ